MNLHPSPTAGRWERIGKTSRYKCGMCGFPRDANRGLRSESEWAADGITVSGTFSGEDLTLHYSGGCCPMCGTFRHDKMRPVSQARQGKGGRRTSFAGYKVTGRKPRF